MDTINSLLDTNSVSAIIKKDDRAVKKLKEAVDEGKQLFISVITDYEINRGLFATNATRKLRDYEILRRQLKVLWLDDLKISKKAAEIHADLKQRGLLIQDADILIAAIALQNNLTVITNDKHFSRIQNLKVDNWLKEEDEDN
jgi:tRNA(fMet)-specific endonuclease VapC